MIRETAKALARQVPAIDALIRQRDGLLIERRSLLDEIARLRAASNPAEEAFRYYGDRKPFCPNGHFHSPIPALAEIRRDYDRLSKKPPRSLPDIDLREPEQLSLLERLSALYHDLPFGPDAQPGLRYFYENPYYSYSDAIFLNAMIRHVKPRKIIEAGSGFSSCMTLDTNERWFNDSIDCTFIEPYPDLMLSLLKAGDRERIKLRPSRLQDIEPSLFDTLTENDILFIDSTHCSKTGSDVNYLFFEVLPRLEKGVYVHFHDIFYPFEYPLNWIEEGRAWNEQYLLRAFLYGNRNYDIVLFNTFLENFHESFFTQHMPLCLKNRGGSIWLRRVTESR